MSSGADSAEHERHRARDEARYAEADQRPAQAGRHSISASSAAPDSSDLGMKPRAGLSPPPAPRGPRARGSRSARPPAADPLHVEAGGHREAVHVGQLDVEQHHVGLAARLPRRARRGRRPPRPPRRSPRPRAACARWPGSRGGRRRSGRSWPCKEDSDPSGRSRQYGYPTPIIRAPWRARQSRSRRRRPIRRPSCAARRRRGRRTARAAALHARARDAQPQVRAPASCGSGSSRLRLGRRLRARRPGVRGPGLQPRGGPARHARARAAGRGSGTAASCAPTRA